MVYAQKPQRINKNLQLICLARSQDTSSTNINQIFLSTSDVQLETKISKLYHLQQLQKMNT